MCLLPVLAGLPAVPPRIGGEQNRNLQAGWSSSQKSAGRWEQAPRLGEHPAAKREKNWLSPFRVKATSPEKHTV